MSDNHFENTDDLSLDALIEETKQQINAPPGEIGAHVDDAAFLNSEIPQQPDMPEEPEEDFQEPPVSRESPSAPENQDTEFVPDFGDAFDEYGEYNEPEPAPMPPLGDYVLDDEEEAEDDTIDAPPPAKPKRKTGKRIVPLFVKIIAYVVIVGVIAVGLGYGIWECARDVLAFGRSSEKLTVVVKASDTVDDIAHMLQEKGVIKYPWLFKFYCDFTDSGDRMDPGRYVISYNYDYHALVSGMIASSPDRVTVRVTIPEGYSCAQIFDLMEENKVCSAEDLKAAAASAKFDYWFLEGIPAESENRLEGFLFPDTYDFYESDDPERVLDKLLSNFQKKFSDETRARLDALNENLAERLRGAGYDEDYIASHAFTVYDLITVASMIEKETAAYDESFNISSVIYNRLCHPGDYPMLNIDATVVYAMGGKLDHPLTYEDTQIESPYNTYLVPGLPIGPISNPGLDSISAALYPAETDYYYYALDEETGYHHFSQTYDEHQQFLEGQSNEE